jgi:hypothetical protein
MSCYALLFRADVLSECPAISHEGELTTSNEKVGICLDHFWQFEEHRKLEGF